MANSVVSSSQREEAEQASTQFPPLTSEYYVPQTMPKILGHRDMFFMYLAALFLLSNAVLSASGGAVSLLYLVIGAVFFFLPCAVVAAQLGVLFPHEGSLYNWTYHALGGFWSFFVGLLFWVTGMLAVIIGSDAFVSTLQGLHNSWLHDPWQQGLVILAVLAVATAICTGRMRMARNFINIVAMLTILTVLLIVISGTMWLVQGHYMQTDFSFLATNWEPNSTNFFFFGITALSFVGAAGPLNLAGEFKGARENEALRRSIIRRHLALGSICVAIMYVLVVFSILVVPGRAMEEAIVLPFEGFITVHIVLGELAEDLAVLGFLFYCIGAVVIYMTISSRIIMAAAIDQRIPTWFGRLNAARSPRNTLLFQAFFSGFVVVVVFIAAPLINPMAIGGSASNVLNVLYNEISAATTLVWTLAISFLFINAVLIYRRHTQYFRENLVAPLPVIWLCIGVGGIACILTIVGILLYSWIPALVTNDQWWLPVSGLVVGVVIVAGIGSLFANSEATWEVTSREFAAQSQLPARRTSTGEIPSLRSGNV
jgi:amino acid transporter